MNGIQIGLLLGVFFLTIYFIGRYRKENITEVFTTNNCFNKKKIYIYWSRNNPAGKKPVPIFIDDEYIGNCKKRKISSFDIPKKSCKLTSLSIYNTNIVNINTKGPIYVLINDVGLCEKFNLESK
ncbi:MAG: hypothetical protein ACK5NF_07985 [Bacilli bacterium]